MFISILEFILFLFISRAGFTENETDEIKHLELKELYN